MQISESLRNVEIELGGLRLTGEELCGGTLVTGMTGSGKTVSVVNPLATAYAKLGTDGNGQKAAVFYFNCKGSAHREFIAGLPEDRREDVIVVSADSGYGISLFEEANWRSRNELNGAVVQFLEEFGRNLSDENRSLKHDPFWERQRVRVAEVLVSLETDRIARNIDAKTAGMFDADRLVALLRRLDAFIEHVGIVCSRSGQKPEKQPGRGPTPEEIAWAKEHFGKSVPGRKNLWPKDVKGEREMAKMLLDLKNPPKSREETEFERFYGALDYRSQVKANALVREFYDLAEVTRSCVFADLRGVVASLMTETAKTYLHKKRVTTTLEEIIQEGEILVIDLPLADGGQATLPVLQAVKLALFSRLLGRRSALCCGVALSERPVCVVLDEFQNLVSKGKTNGEDMLLAQCREFGVGVVLATQSLALLLGTLQNENAVAALVANCRLKIFGKNGDRLTNSLAAEACGTTSGQEVCRVPVWNGGEAFRRFVTEVEEGGAPVVEPRRFGELATGQFYAATPRGDTVFLDMRRSLGSPKTEYLRRSAE
ncbi:MAG: TraM recognition domain-containing protein [Chthoniobacteraceae bacterium]